MAVIAEGLNKTIVYKKETLFGVLPGPTGAKSTRRVTGNFNLNKEIYESEEIRTDRQRQDVRHGVRSVEGTINGELSPNTYADWFASAVARNFTPGVEITGLSLDVTATADGYTLTRDAGSFLTDGIKVGDVVRLSGANLNAMNIAKNLLVTAVFATDLDVIVLNSSAMFAQTDATASQVEVYGGKTYAPLTGHTDDSYTFEEVYSGLSLGAIESEVFTGNKINTVGVSLPATGLATVDFSFMGQDLKQAGNTAYFTSPAPQGTNSIFAAVNGALLVDGERLALVTGLTININRNLTTEAVVGSNLNPEIFEGRIVVDGEFTALFTGGTFRDIFNEEQEVSLAVALTTSNQKDSDFMTIVLPRIKINSDTKNDGEQGIVSTHSFQALLNTNNTSFNQTTIAIQDSTLVI